MAPLFTRKRITSYVDGMAVAADRLAATWAAAPDGRVDLSAAGTHYALDVLGRSVFGGDVESAAPVLRATVPVLNAYAARRILSPVRLPGWVPTRPNRTAERARRELWGLVDGLIAERRAGALDGDDLLTLLLTARDPEDGIALGDDAVREQALILLVGGHETTATTLALTLQLLGRHPDVQQRVRDEVEAVVGDRPVGADDLPRLTYAAQVVDETMRLYPPGHTLVRHAHQATTLDGSDGAARAPGGDQHLGRPPQPRRVARPRPLRPRPVRRRATSAATTTCPSAAGRGAASASTWPPPSWSWRWPPSSAPSASSRSWSEPPLEVAVALRPRGDLPCRVTPAR